MSFLSDEQRAQLDTALAQKAAESAAAAKQKKMIENPLGDRKGRSIRGNVENKKGGTGGGTGGGGKFHWGSIFTNSDHVAVGVMDRGDPNYDSGSDIDSTSEFPSELVDLQQDLLKSEVEDYKQKILTISQEYFSSGDIVEVSASLEDLPGGIDVMHYFVKKLILLALDRKDREREMASVLLSSLYSNVIPPEQVRKGFEAVIESIDDTVLDVPDAPDLIALFIVRAIIDDVLPPAITTKISGSTLPSSTLKSKVDQLLTSRHSAEKILRCWGPGSNMKAQEAKEAITKVLQEFSMSHDAKEVSKCLSTLSLPFFNHELIKQAIHMAMSSATHCASIIGLISGLTASGEVSQGQLIKGLQRVAVTLPDLCLDNPIAAEQYEQVMADVKASGLLEDVPEEALMISRSDSTVSSAQNDVGHSLSQFKSLTAAAIREYFDSSDEGEVTRRILELQDPGLRHLIVKQSIVMALDRKDTERELISKLLRHMKETDVLHPDQTVLGFVILLSALDDIILDVPDAVRLSSLFLARAVVDEVLSPAALSQILRALPVQASLGISVVRSAGAMLSAAHSSARLSYCWKNGFKGGRQLIDLALREFLTTRDKQEASRCIAELGIPSFHHEIVSRAIELAFESDNEESTKQVFELLSSLFASGVVNNTHMRKGFDKVRARMEQEALDFGPHTQKTFELLTDRATKEGLLTVDA